MLQADIVNKTRRILGDNAIPESLHLDKNSVTKMVKSVLGYSDTDQDESDIAPGDCIEYSRVLLGDSVPPYRWDDLTLTEYAREGIEKVRSFRADCVWGFVGKRFMNTVCHYVAHKAYASESDDTGDAQRSATHLAQFNDGLISTPHRWSDDEIESYIKEGIRQVISYRSDCFEATDDTLPQRFSDAVIHYASYKAYSLETTANNAQRRDFHLGQFRTFLTDTSYRWNDSVLNGIISDGVKEITKRRPDVALHTYGENEIHLPDYLEQALIYYTVSKCYEIRLENKTEAAKSQYFSQMYIAEAYGGK